VESRAFALITGLFVLGLGACIIVWAHWLAKDPLARKPYRVVSGIPVSGLKKEAAVRYRGMEVGRVTSIGLDKRDKRGILIGIEVNEEIDITRGTYAQLGMEGITGIAYVHLLDDGKDMALKTPGPDGTIDLVLRPSFLDSLSDGADGTVREVRELIASLHDLLNPDNRKRIGTTLASLEKISSQLEATTQRLPGFIDRNDTRLATLLGEGNQRNLRETLEQLNRTMAALPELVKEADILVRDARSLAAHVGKLSVEAQTGASSIREDTLPRVNSLAETVERSAQRVGRVAAELDRRPESLIWGRQPARPGPGEPGFAP
jgi:phospholipid/cholesterol/gamma-HCH transport system substrate-binding protein